MVGLKWRLDGKGGTEIPDEYKPIYYKKRRDLIVGSYLSGLCGLVVGLGVMHMNGDFSQEAAAFNAVLQASVWTGVLVLSYFFA